MKILHAKEGDSEKTGETSSLSPFPGPLRFVTILSRFAKNGKAKRSAAFGGYLEKPLEKESLFAGWIKAILDFVFSGVSTHESLKCSKKCPF